MIWTHEPNSKNKFALKLQNLFLQAIAKIGKLSNFRIQFSNDMKKNIVMGIWWWQHNYCSILFAKNNF